MSKIWKCGHWIRNRVCVLAGASPMSKRCSHGRLQLNLLLCRRWKGSFFIGYAGEVKGNYYPTCQNKIAPSDPPLASKPSWCGCHATQLASFLWPRKVWTGWASDRTSKSFKKWSLLAVMNQFPFLFHFTSITCKIGTGDTKSCEILREKKFKMKFKSQKRKKDGYLEIKRKKSKKLQNI